MNENPLRVISTEKKESSITTAAKPKLRDIIRAKFDRLWLQNPDQFDPMRNAPERVRINRTENLILNYFTPEKMVVADLGCGYGELSVRMAEKGAKVNAIDISNIALKKLERRKIANINLRQDFVPKTVLDDDSMDLVICTDLIAYLPEDQFRLFFSELARIVHPQGFVVCSTPIDFYSDESLSRFATLAETEFKIEKWVLSSHALYITLHKGLTLPQHYIKASKDKEYDQEQRKKHTGKLSYAWYQMNTHFPFLLFWRFMQIILNPIVRIMEQSESFVKALEKICQFLWSERGISHALFIARRRPLIETFKDSEIPIERKQKRHVWE